MRKNSSLVLCVMSVILSIVTFIFAHIVFGIEYVLKYYISVFIVSTIPLWIIVYCFLKMIYKHYYYNCIIKIFEIKEDKEIINRIFGLNTINIFICCGISVFILACYVYFGENGIILLPEEMDSYIPCYFLGIVPIVCGSFAGAITIRVIMEAWNFFQHDINEKNIDNYLVLLLKLRRFLYISVIATYAMCLAMYVVVLVGPISSTEDKVIQQPLLLFLFVLILWPLAVHIFCRQYLERVKTKCFEARFGNIGKTTADMLQEEIDKRKYIARLFSDSSDRYKNYSLLVSFLISISQIIAIFWG